MIGRQVWRALLAGAGFCLVSGETAVAQVFRDTARFSAIAREGSDVAYRQEIQGIGCAPLPKASGSGEVWVNNLRRSAELVRRELLGSVSSIPAGHAFDQSTFVENDNYQFSRILVASRVPGVRTWAYVVVPQASSGPKPVVLLLHGSGTVPSQAYSMRFEGDGGLVSRADSTPFIGLGMELARAGFTVIAPVLGVTPSNAPNQLPWLPLSVWGEILRVKTGRGGTETFLVSELQAYMDYASDQKLVRGDEFYVVGWNEGAYIGSIVAGLDPRIRGVVRLEAPFNRRGYKNADGMLRDAAFMHTECNLGDVAQAAMLGGKPLLYAAAVDDANEVNRKNFRSSAIVDSVRALYAALGKSANLSIQIGTQKSDSVRRSVSTWLAGIANLPIRTSPPFKVITPKKLKFEEALTVERINEVGTYLGELGSCASVLPAVATAPDDPALVSRLVAGGLQIAPRSGAGARILLRQSIDSSRGYRLSRIEYGVAGGRRWRALIAEPLETGEHPVVVSFNGIDDLADLFAVGPRPSSPYMNGYADVLAKRGFIVIVPIIPYWVPNSLAPISSARSLGRSTIWSVIAQVYRGAIDATIPLVGVDTTRIAAYGISFGGVAAGIVTAIDPRIKSLVYTNIPVDYRSQFDKGSGAFGTTWMANACGTADASLLAIAPRPMIWESGEDPLMLNENMEVVTRLRDRYRRLGRDEQFTFLRHSFGHTTFPENIRIFGR